MVSRKKVRTDYRSNISRPVQKKVLLSVLQQNGQTPPVAPPHGVCWETWRKGNLSHLRFFLFVFSFIVVAVVYYGLKLNVVNDNPAAPAGTFAELIWFLAGNAMYHAIGITMALVMKDNRAFCKYLCPITVFYKTVGRFSLLRIAGDDKKCTGCTTCISQCPMSIDIPRYIKNGDRVKSTDCIMCMHCIAACPEAALKTSIGSDYAGKNFTR